MRRCLPCWICCMVYLLCVCMQWFKCASLLWFGIQTYNMINWVTVLPAYLRHLVLDSITNYTFDFTWGKFNLPFNAYAKLTPSELRVGNILDFKNECYFLKIMILLLILLNVLQGPFLNKNQCRSSYCMTYAAATQIPWATPQPAPAHATLPPIPAQATPSPVPARSFSSFDNEHCHYCNCTATVPAAFIMTTITVLASTMGTIITPGITTTGIQSGKVTTNDLPKIQTNHILEESPSNLQSSSHWSHPHSPGCTWLARRKSVVASRVGKASSESLSWGCCPRAAHQSFLTGLLLI